MDPIEIAFHPHDLHAFFFGKAVDLVIASRSRTSLANMVVDSTFYEYVASTARIMQTQYELSLMDRERTKKVSGGE